MTRVQVIQPTDSLVTEVVARLTSDGTDYSRNLVVFPGKRPAHFLRKEIASNVGAAFIPPTIRSVDDLVDTIADQHTGQAVLNIDTLDAIAILLELHRALPGRMGGDQFLSPERFFPLGEKLFGELEELKLAGLSEDSVRLHTSVVSSEGINTLADLYSSFYRKLAEERLSTRAMRYELAARTYRPEYLPHFSTIIVAGLFALTQTEQVLLKEMIGEERVKFLFVRGPGLAETLQVLGIVDDGEAPSNVPVNYRFVEAPDLHGQVAALTAEVKSSIDNRGGPSERDVLVLPRPGSLFPVVNHFLPEFSEDQYNIALEYPFIRTPLAGLFHSLAEASDRQRGSSYFGPDYLRVLLHPYVKNVRVAGLSETGRILVHTVEERLTGQSGRSMRSLEEIESDDELFTRAALMVGEEGVTPDILRMHLKTLHDRLFRAWTPEGTLREFSERCTELVRFVHNETTASRHPHFRSFATSALEALQQLGDSRLAGNTMASVPASFELLAHILRSVSIPFPGSPLHGFQILGLLETRGLRFENVYLLDANDDVLPPAAPPPLLPETVRKRLKMETRQDRERIIEYYLSVLFAGATNVWISWNESDGQEKSRFVERLLWERQQRERNVEAYKTVTPVEYTLALDTNKPKPVGKSNAEVAALSRRSLSTGALDTYLRCQLRFYYGTVLKIRERDDLSGEVETKDIGDLIHSTLQRFFDPLKGAQLDPDSLDVARMQSLAGEFCTETFGKPGSAAEIMMRDRILSQLTRFLEEYQKPAAVRSTVVVHELEAPLSGTAGGGNFRVRVDRVEERALGDGRSVHHILDYKTGGNPRRYGIRFDKLNPEDRSTWYDAIGSFQLFLYQILYARSRGLDPSETEAAYLFLGLTTMSEEIEVGLFEKGETDRKQKLESLERIVEVLVREMHDPHESFRPTEHFDEECPNCPFTTMCGTTWTRRGRSMA